jgi:hypothetical protein
MTSYLPIHRLDNRHLAKLFRYIEHDPLHAALTTDVVPIVSATSDMVPYTPP